MIHLTRALSEEEVTLYTNSDFPEELKNQACLFFDIETTGLSPETAFVFLIGCIEFGSERQSFHQFLISSVQEEATLLSSFFALANHYDTWVHFNGTTFDLPFLKKRTAALRKEADTLHFPEHSVDLYQRYRSLKPLLPLSGMKQRELERALNWNRTDQLSGKEVVSCFFFHAAGSDEKAQELLLQHNHDDLMGMLQILKLEAILALKSGILPSKIKAKQASRGLLLSFSLSSPLPIRIDKTDSETNIQLQVEGKEGQMLVPVYSDTMRFFLSEYKNYVYLPLERQVIHKSLAGFVDKDYREPAKPENCFVEKSGEFLPVPGKRNQKAGWTLFQRAYGEKPDFLELEPLLCTEKNMLQYMQHVLKSLLN